MKRFENWGDELRYRVERIGNDGAGEDEKYAGGVYDMAIQIVEMCERDIPQLDKIEQVYNAIKYGDGVN